MFFLLRRTSIFLLLCASAAFAGTRIDLNDNWFFRTDPTGAGASSGWGREMPPETEAVALPHTWNIGTHEDYEGVAWYFRRFAMPSVSSEHVELHFGATFYSARVFLNGVEIGSHEGGYTSYHFDITGQLRPSNHLAVMIDNRPTAGTIPGLAQRLAPTGWYDWWHYGGIIRDVWLTAGSPTVVRRQQIRSKLNGGRADVTDSVFVDNFGRRELAAEVVATIQPEGSSATVATVRRRVGLKPGSNKVDLSLAIENPRLWDLDHPNLYRMSVSVVDARGRVMEEHSDTFGVRTVEIRDRRLLINGERVRLSGMTRHQESPWEGHAETRGTMLYDYNDMKNLQVTLTRPVHYPQHPFILDYADRNGILLVPEIPMWQFTEKQMADPRVVALAKQQMREMIEQAGNHPSIFAWSVCNESETNRPGGIEYFKTMKQMINELDPTRFVTFANNNLPIAGKPEEDAAYYADFIMMNQYYGSWAGPRGGLVPALDKIDRDYPDKMLIISEFGAVGIFEANTVDADKLRVGIIREQMAEFARRDWIAGAILWCYQDYKSHRNLWPGQTKGQVDHGLVDENRQRRPSYDMWREMNFPLTIEAEFNDWYKVPTAFKATLARRAETELPSYALHDYRVVWELRDERQKILKQGESVYADLKREAINAEWTPSGQEMLLTLKVRVLRPTGLLAAERTFVWRAKVVGEQVFGPVQ